MLIGARRRSDGVRPHRSNWGGTMVEHWQPNASLNAQVCKSAAGGKYAPDQLERWDIDAGALWNGMYV